MIEDFLSEKHKRKRKKRRQFFWVAVVIVIVIVIVIVAWIFIWSPVFRLKQIVIQGENTVPSSTVASLLQENLAQNNGFALKLLGAGNMLAWPDAVVSSELASVPQVASLTVTKNYWYHTVTATVAEREPFAIWCAMPSLDASGDPEGEEFCYWFDNTGTMFADAFDTEGNAIFAVHDYAEGAATGTAALGSKILPDFFVPNLISILNVLKQSGLNVKEIALEDLSLEQVNVSTYDGPTIYFSLRFPSDVDLPVLQSLMAKPGFDNLQYVDFTVENRAFYK